MQEIALTSSSLRGRRPKQSRKGFYLPCTPGLLRFARNDVRVLLKILIVAVAFLATTGCGFQLRGQVALPAAFQRLKLCPEDRFNDFQRILRRNLKLNGICVIDSCQAEAVNTLSITNQGFSERNIAYGSNAQVNRVLLQFQLQYQILDPDCQVICPENTLRVERELVINPNAIVGTETERHQVEAELYQDAAIQLIRQLSVAVVV